MTIASRDQNHDPPGAGDNGVTDDDHGSSDATTSIGPTNESESSASQKFSTYSLVVLLLNLVAAAYLISQQSWHRSTIQSEREVQLKILQNELEVSESQINILRYKMDVLEQTLVNMEKERESRISLNHVGDESNVDGVAIDIKNEHELQLLEEGKQLAMDEFHNTVLELELDAA